MLGSRNEGGLVFELQRLQLQFDAGAQCRSIARGDDAQGRAHVFHIGGAPATDKPAAQPDGVVAL